MGGCIGRRRQATLGTIGAEEVAVLPCVNLRDLGSVCPTLRTGMVYRGSQVLSSKEMERIGVKTVVDLRKESKMCRQAGRERRRVLREGESLRVAAPEPFTPDSASSMEQVAGKRFERSLHTLQRQEHPPCAACSGGFKARHGVDAAVYHADLHPWTFKRRIFLEMPPVTQASVAVAVCLGRSPQETIARAMLMPGRLGLSGMYRLLLDNASVPIARALRLFADSANYPVLVHCVIGKDRTGLVIMLLLLLCGMDEQAVVDDYLLSEALLRTSRSKGELSTLQDFLISDEMIASKEDTARGTLAHLAAKYGGARGYARAIGLSDAEVRAIRGNLLAPGLKGAASAASVDICAAATCAC
ncbi:hypothetical protein WJX81_001496 [Elliptochloris bilobata]|uniref:Tyrosine specific protein phosphatases domain-containing protein n=1 Tax=Elliptochloris bilobata TaxID=381761 RepID=A0AAW1S824_9CHLO